MREFPGLDRRRHSSRTLSIIVDIGLVCLPSLGELSAKSLFLAYDVPPTVASRVLFHAGERRANALCQALDDISSPERTKNSRAGSSTCTLAPGGDKNLVAALRGALQAMMLTHGCRVKLDVAFGVLNFEREMLLLREALELLSIDPDELPEW